VLGWAQTLGQFVARHLVRIAFTILVLYFIYRDGDELAQDLDRLLHAWLGERADHYVEIATRSLRATVNGTLVVGLFDGILVGITAALAGAQHAVVWGALTGLFAIVPFLGYVAVAGIAVALVAANSAIAAAAVLAVGVVILFVGDKVVRPILVGNATQLGFVWVLMGSLGGVELMGLLGLFIGPVVLTLAGALWRERTQRLRSGSAPPESVRV
jgi:predicted PurR-regulated permease PerM